jgi:hypothetical protein
MKNTTKTTAPQPQAAAEARHTPTPWRWNGGRSISADSRHGFAKIVATAEWSKADRGALSMAEAEANAALIVAAVNERAGLVARVAELEAALEMMIAMADAKVSPSWEKVKQARATLAKEGGK